MRAALFDMDRTLVRKETASLYVRYLRARGAATWRDLARVLWWRSQYTLGILDAPRVVERALRSLAGTEEASLVERCNDWFERDVAVHVTEAGRRAVDEHKTRGDLVAIVTGANVYAAHPLARHLGIEHVVATELEVGRDGRFTGRLVHPLCYAHGKVERTSRLAQRFGFRIEEATFYSDSYTDLPLLDRVATAVVVNPDPRLRAVARRRGWRIERW